MKFLGFFLNGILAFVMALMCLISIGEYLDTGADTFSTFLKAFAVFVFSVINIWGISSDD